MSTDSSPIRILVVDDHQLIRVGIATLLQEFAVDFRRAPAGIFRGHSPDQASDFQCHFGPPATRPGTPADSERHAMPADHGLGFHDDQSVRPSRPNPPQKDPERAPCMPWRLAVLLGRTLLVAFCIALSSCQSHRADTAPSIEFSRIPPAAQGGRERVDTIAGRVQNARPGQQIVIYARSGTWWVQPWPDRPFIPIHADSTWQTETHLGYEYAALLVDPEYHPPPTMDVAPAPGGSVVLVNIVKGTGTPQLAPTKPLQFSGYDWEVRTIASDKGGTNNLYDPDNAWTDAAGALHLQMKKKSGRWTCAEVFMNRSLGYGTYAVTVRDTSQLEPAAVFSMFTFDEWGGDQHFREMEIEISRWGDAASKNNAQYVIQPFYIPGNLLAFTAPSGALIHRMRWESGRASFRTVRGTSDDAGARLVAEHEFTSGIPSSGQARVRLILYVVASDKNPLQKPSEVVIEKFEYLP